MSRLSFTHLHDRVRKSGLSMHQKSGIASIIDLTARGTNICTRPMTDLCILAGMSKPKLQGVLAELVELELLRLERIKTNKTRRVVLEERVMLLGRVLNGDPLFIKASPSQDTDTNGADDDCDGQSDEAAPEPPKPASEPPAAAAEPRREAVTDTDIPAHLLDADGDGQIDEAAPPPAAPNRFASKGEALEHLRRVGEHVGEVESLRTVGPTPAPQPAAPQPATPPPQAAPAPALDSDCDGQGSLFGAGEASKVASQAPPAVQPAPPQTTPRTSDDIGADVVHLWGFYVDLWERFQVADTLARQKNAPEARRGTRAQIEAHFADEARSMRQSVPSRESRVLIARLTGGMGQDKFTPMTRAQAESVIRGLFNSPWHCGADDCGGWGNPKGEKGRQLQITSAFDEAGRITAHKGRDPMRFGGEGSYVWEAASWPEKPKGASAGPRHFGGARPGRENFNVNDAHRESNRRAIIERLRTGTIDPHNAYHAGHGTMESLEEAIGFFDEGARGRGAPTWAEVAHLRGGNNGNGTNGYISEESMRITEEYRERLRNPQPGQWSSQ